MSGDLLAVEERIITATTVNLSEVREEFKSALEGINRRMDSLDRRMDRMAETLTSLDSRMVAALTKWADKLDKDETALATNYHAQQRAILDLQRRVEALEKKAS